MSVHDVADFLARHPPFAGLDEATLREIEKQAQIEWFPPGANILVQSGAPAEWLYVVRAGCVSLLDDGETVAVLEPGESFGHPSLLSGLPPAFTATADEETLCYLLPAEVARRVLSGQAGLSFVARTLSHRLQTATTARPEGRDTGGVVRVGALVRGEPLQRPRSATVREAAQALDDHRRTSLLVPLHCCYGIVTDVDIRRAVAQGLAGDTPIERIMSAPARTTHRDELAFEALLTMLDAGVHHLPVVDDDERALGVVVVADLVGLDGRSPVALRRAIDRAGSVAELAQTAQRLPETVIALLDTGVAATEVCRVIAAHTDALTRRLLALGMNELGPAPAPWAWLVFGSDARREQTLATDQDNGLVYQGEGPDLDDYFRGLAERVNDGLDSCGIRACRYGVVARNADWRGSLDHWIARFEQAMEDPTRKAIMFASVAFDLRHVAGGLDAEAVLRRVISTARDRPDFLGMIGRSAVAVKPPLGFLKDFVVIDTGEHKGRLDLKRYGVTPIVNLARLHALQAGVAGNRTRERLRGAADLGGLDGELAEALIEAFDALTAVRMQHQAAQVEQDREPDNYVDPHQLPPLTRAHLRQAFRVIAKAQKAQSIYQRHGVG